MRHSYIFLFLCCWQIKSIISQREVDEGERDRNEINDIFKRMRRAYETGDHNSIKPKTWGIIVKNNDARVWNELYDVPFINIGSDPYNEQEPNPMMNEVAPEHNDISVEMPDKFGSSSPETPKNFDIFHEYDTDDVQVPDSLLDVMKMEKFWTWLQSWTATYMELLLERIHESVVDEVDKQLKIRLPNTTETVTKPVTITYEESEDIYDNNDDKNDDTYDESYTYNDNYEYVEDNNQDEEQLVVGAEESVLEEDTLDEGYPIIDERIKETDEVRAKRNNVEVKSGQIYGNSLNTDKVTNVFIFLRNPEDIFSVIRPLIGDEDIISDEEDNNTGELDQASNDEVIEEIVTEEEVTESETKVTETVTEETIQNLTEDFTQTDVAPVAELPQESE